MFYGNIEAGHFPHTDTTYQLSFFIRGDASELDLVRGMSISRITQFGQGKQQFIVIE